MKRPWSWMLALAMIALPAPAAAQPAPGDAAKSAARGLAETGKRRFESGDYAGAIDALHDAEKYYRAPTITRMRALAHEKLEQLLEAKELHRQIATEQLAADAPAEFLEAKEASEKSLESLEKRIPKVEITLLHAPPGTGVSLDGKPVEAAALGQPIQVNPGKHMLVIEPPGKAKITRALDLKAGALEKINLNLAPTPQPPALPSTAPSAVPVTQALQGASPPTIAGAPSTNTPSPGQPALSRRMPVATYVAYGVSAVGLVTGAVLGGLAFGKQDEFNRNPTIETSDEGEALALQSDLALSFAVIAAVAGTVVWLKPSLENKPIAARTIYVAPAVGGLTIGGRF